MSDDSDRPPHKDESITTPISGESLDRALKKAGGLKRLRAIIRLFVDLWGSDEWPPSMDFSEGDIQEQTRRAQKVPRRKKK